MSVFTGIEKQKVDVRPPKENSYFVPGNYKAEILASKLVERKDGSKVFVGELRILESDNEDVKVGDEKSYFQTFVIRDMAQKNIAQYIISALGGGRDAAEVTEEVCDQVVSDKNPLAGKHIGVRAFSKVSAKTGKEYVNLAFYPV